MCFSILLPSSVSIFMTISLNTLSGKLLISISLVFFFFFLEFYLVLSFVTYSSVSSFCLTFCVCFYESGKATTSCIEGMALCRSFVAMQTVCTKWLWWTGWGWSGRRLGACWSELDKMAKAPGAFQTAASVLWLRVSEFMLKIFKSKF